MPFTPRASIIAGRLYRSITPACACRLTTSRTADFRRGERLGKDDQIVKWLKPTKPRSIGRDAYDALPEFLMVRECRVRLEQPGFRVRSLVSATTLLDAGEFTRDKLSRLDCTRWNSELDWGSRASVESLEGPQVNRQRVVGPKRARSLQGQA